jgi:hypothetical protein
VEKTSGETFRHYLRHHIVDPLDLHDTGVDMDDSIVSHMAQGYQMMDDKLLHCDFIDMGWLLGCGDVQRMKNEVGHILFDSPEYFSAQREMFTEQLSAAQNEPDKKRAIWHLNQLKAMESAERQVPSALSADTGTFGYGWYFFVRGNALYCRGIVHDNNLSQLTHIIRDLYQLDESTQLEFKKNATGLVVGINFLFGNGSEHYWPTQIELEKNKATWQDNRAKAGQQPMPDSAVLSAYAGTYEGGLVLFRQGGDFICRNGERGDQLFTLQFITGSLFQLDENVQVEFEKEREGTITAIKMYWVNGSETVKEKI